MKKKKIVFTIPSPKELYMFNVLSKELKKYDFDVHFLIRDFGPNLEIADHFGIDYTPFGNKKFVGFKGKFKEMIINDLSGYKLYKKIKPDIIIGDVFLGHPSKLLDIPTIAFVDGNPFNRLTKFIYKIYFADLFVTPIFVSLNKKNVIRYYGTQELFYLNKDVFYPDETILKKYGLSKNESYFIIRISGLGMSHDIGLKSISYPLLIKMIKKLEEFGRVLISSEKHLKYEKFNFEKYILKNKPYHIHHLLYYSSFLIADTALPMEAVYLGTPSIQISPINRKLESICMKFDNYRTFSHFGLIKIIGCNYEELILNEINDFLQNRKEKTDIFKSNQNNYLKKTDNVIEIAIKTILNNIEGSNIL